MEKKEIEKVLNDYECSLLWLEDDNKSQATTAFERALRIYSDYKGNGNYIDALFWLGVVYARSENERN